MKMFEDQKDTIKLTSLVSEVVDKDTQAKIDIVKQRLIDRFGYDEQSRPTCLNSWRASSRAASRRTRPRRGCRGLSR
jgi:predicted Ser/Thr protein kinase